MLSIYKDRMIQPASMHLIKRTESWLLETNPMKEITTKNLSNQAWDAYLRPYNALLSLQTYLESSETLGKGAIWTSSWRSPFKKAFLTLSWEICH
jgi:hypothetical protein